jgi:hypothetical protein
MNAPRITVAITDWQAFEARYGLVMARTGNTVDGLPELCWQAGPGQTAEQARLVASELKDGMRWKNKLS